MEKPEPDHGGCTWPRLILASGSGVITCILKEASEAECAGQDGGKSLFQARKPSESRWTSRTGRAGCTRGTDGVQKRFVVMGRGKQLEFSSWVAEEKPS